MSRNWNRQLYSECGFVLEFIGPSLPFWYWVLI
jgi:hypothetical protein